MAFVTSWNFRIAVVQVDALQSEFVFQVEMVVYHDVLQPRLVDESQQSFAKDGLRVGLLQMQHIQSLLEERIQYEMFLHEKRGRRNRYQIHCIFFLYLQMKAKFFR